MLTKLISWYQKNKRDLLWRKTKDPYKIMVSEFMLVQTTVATVVNRYEKFLQEFPTLKSLAQAPLWKVKNAWSGLGYYSRAENLWRACQKIERLGRFPIAVQELKKLPGFGPYLANAVASLAFEVPAPVFDANVRRVLRRVFDGEDPGILETLLVQNKLKPSVFNQASMELGALICQARAPKCSLCPVYSFCQTRGVHPSEKKVNKSQKIEILINVSRDKNDRVFIVPRGLEELFLKNSWGLPMKILDACPKNGAGALTHSIMRWRIHAHVQHKNETTKKNGRWVSKKDLGRYLYSSLWQKALAFTT